MTPIYRLIPALFLLLSVTACQYFQPDPSISNASRQQQEDYYGRLMMQNEELSFRTSNFLRGNLFDELFREDPNKLLKTLDEIRKNFGAEYDSDMLDIMSDICYCIAKRTGNEDEAVRFYLSSAYYSYQLLFSTDHASDSLKKVHLDRFDPSNCQQLLRYNSSIAKIFEYLRKRKILNHDSYELKTVSGVRICFSALESELPFADGAYSDFIPCASYHINDLTLINRQFGIGIPLITLFQSSSPYQSLRLPGNCPMPATAVLHFDLKQKNSSIVNARFQLFDTFITEKIDVNGQPVPLALDYSTPVAAFSKYLPADNDHLLMNVIDPQRVKAQTGLYMLEPYNPGKIPIVLVHGLMSSPSTWIRMVNALRNYSFIRRNYQFWFYKYSSGNPILLSAIPLRDALLAAEKEFAVTPEAKRSFSQMVIVGHSMGGLITAVVTQDKPEYFVEQFSGEKWSALSTKLSENDVKKLQTVFFKRPDFVQRVVFMAVPHKGSVMAKWMLARFGSSLIRIPQYIFTQAADLIHVLGISGKDNVIDIEKILYTGVDNLDPDNRFIQMLSKSSFASDIPRHSIIGNEERSNTPGGTDGVVSYESAHLNHVESELIVKSGHSVHQSPEAIRELVRILRVHLREAEKHGFVPTRDDLERLKNAPEKRGFLFSPAKRNESQVKK